MHQLPPLDPMNGRYSHQQNMYDPGLMTPGPGSGPGPSSGPYLPPPSMPAGYPDYPFDNQPWQPYPPPPPHQPGPDFGQQWYMPSHGQAPPSTAPLTSQSSSPYPPMRGSIHSIQSHPSPQQKDEATAKKKKKRKGEDSPNSADEKEKRTKTGRACDACRTKKIRCDILPSDSTPICAHCKSSNLECTFYMPITETRFKKKRQDEERPRPPSEIPARVEGPTSLSFLLHTSLPASASQAYDLRYHHMWEVSEDGNGIIRVKQPPHSKGDEEPSSGSKLAKSALNAQNISLLVNAYFDNQAQFFPIISRAEFAAKANPSPFLLYSICGIGSTMREFPREIFSGIRGVINGMLRSNDILSDARLEHVQALLVLSQVGDLNAQPTAATASACMMRTASAIRMAQDLGMHRESHLRAQTPQDLAVVELRRRVWATCVIMDRWYGAALGAPLLVDLLDCDVLLPAGYEIIPDKEPSQWPIEPSFVFLAEHLKLSIIVGRVLKTIYSPTGLKHTTDEQLYALFEDMRAWKENLPSILAYQGSESSMAAGFLHLAYAALHFLFWRPFMRITYVCPPHLKFALESIHWTEMARQASEALDWLSLHDGALDTLFIYPYTATSCALIQYHTWVRRQDQSALDSLKMVRETALQWEAAVQPDQMSIRRKTCETMTLLYEAALKTPETGERPPAINPTAGVRTRPELGKAVWMKEDAAQQGGIWVVHTQQDKEDSGLQQNSVISQDELGKERPPPEMESTHPAIRARAIKAQSQSSRSPNQYSASPKREDDVVVAQASNVNPQMNVGLAEPPNGNYDMSLLDELTAPGFTFENWNSWFTGVDRPEFANGQVSDGVPMNALNGMGGVNGNGQGSGNMQVNGVMAEMPPGNMDLSQVQVPGWRP